MDKSTGLAAHVRQALQGGQAFDKFESVAHEFTAKDRGRIPDGAEHSAWQIVEHMRRSIEDIYDFSTNESGTYKEKNWPDDYWPSETDGDWDQTVKDYLSLRTKFGKLFETGDPYDAFPWGDGQTLMREVLLVISHEAYHVGELVELKRWLDA